LETASERGGRRVAYRLDDRDDLGSRLGGQLQQPLLCGLLAIGIYEEAVTP
jgi:hypothetical protein